MGLFNRRKKLLIIGLDGVPYEMIEGFARDSVMPNVKEIFKTGQLVPMTVSVPEISSVSWSGFMTGTDSGNHGIFGFVDLVKGQYRTCFPDFRDLRTPAFFDDLAAKKRRAVIINLPSTYPARQIPGVLVSGFVALDIKKALYPLKYLPHLLKIDYEIDVDTKKGKEDKREFIADLHAILEKRRAAAEFFWDKEKWDLFMLTVTGTDRLHHFLFDAFADENHPFFEGFLTFYRAVDDVIGTLYERIAGREEFELIILSDHGFGLVESEVYVNPILERHGFFETETAEPESLEAIGDNARTFALDPARIYIHLNGKYARGKVARGDYTRVRGDIKQLFEEYRIRGQKVIKRAYFKEEIYSPRFLERAPDIVLLANPGFDLKAGLKKKQEFGLSHFTGMHLQDNAFFFTTKKEFLPPGEMTIFHAKEIILKSLLS